MHSEGRDLGDMLASWEKDVAQYRVAAGTDLQQAVQVATVMEHAPAAYRDLLKVVHLANREIYQALRVYVREWMLAQRTYDDHGRHTTPDTSVPMDIGQVKGTKGKGKKGKKGKGKEKGKGKRDKRWSEGETIPVLLASVGQWQVRSQKSQVKGSEERSRRQTSGCSGSSSCDDESSPVIST